MSKWQHTEWLRAACATWLLGGLAAGCAQSTDGSNQAATVQELRGAPIDLDPAPASPEPSAEIAIEAPSDEASSADAGPASDDGAPSAPSPEVAPAPEPSPAPAETPILQTQAAWTQAAPVSDSDPMRMTVDDAGHVWVTVYRSSTNVLLLKYDSDGAQLWTRTLGTAELGVANTNGVTKIAVDHAGNAYIAVSSGAARSSLVKYDAAGTRLGAHAFDHISELTIDVHDHPCMLITKVGLDGVQSYSVGQYDGDATLQWTQPLSTRPLELATDASGTVHLLRRSGSHLDSEDWEDSPVLLEQFDQQGQRLLSVAVTTGRFPKLDRSGTVYVFQGDTLDMCRVALDGTVQCTTRLAPDGFAFRDIQMLDHSAFLALRRPSPYTEEDQLRYRIEYGLELEPQPFIQLGSCEVQLEHLTDSRTFHVIVASNCPSAIEKRTL